MGLLRGSSLPVPPLKIQSTEDSSLECLQLAMRIVSIQPQPQSNEQNIDFWCWTQPASDFAVANSQQISVRTWAQNPYHFLESGNLDHLLVGTLPVAPVITPPLKR